jgi:hypothetical protein
MSLSEKHADLVALAKALGGKEVSSKEEEGKFKLWATFPDQSGKEALQSAVEGRSEGDEIVADIRSEQPDPNSMPNPDLVQSGQKLSAPAK